MAERRVQDRGLRRAVPAAKGDLHWTRTSKLGSVPLTGLARKVLQRLDVMAVQPLQMPDEEHSEDSRRKV